MNDANPVFGRVMRFWRGVFGLSQEELADGLNISLKHVSYLETGRSHPSEALVLRLGHLLNLGQRDFQTLLIAANHFTLPAQPVGPALGVASDIGPLVATLKAWAVLWRTNLGDVIDDDPNSYRLFFMEGGWRKGTVNADDVASWLLMSIQQEVLLHADPRAVRLLNEFQTAPYVPKDWAKRAALARPSYFYPSIHRGRDGSERAYWIVTHSVGSYPLSLGARLWINIVHPQDGKPDLTLEQIAARQPRHAKLVQ